MVIKQGLGLSYLINSDICFAANQRKLAREQVDSLLSSAREHTQLRQMFKLLLAFAHFIPPPELCLRL